MKTRLVIVSLMTLLMAGQTSLAQADGLVDVNPIPELAELEKQALAQEEKVKAFADEQAKKKADQPAESASDEPSKSETPAKKEPKPRRVETAVSKPASSDVNAVTETKTFTTTAGSTTIINNATGPQSVVVNINGESSSNDAVKPKKTPHKKHPVKKPEPEAPVDLWTQQERQYAYP